MYGFVDISLVVFLLICLFAYLNNFQIHKVNLWIHKKIETKNVRGLLPEHNINSKKPIFK